MSFRPRSGRFWLTWSYSRNDWVRQATGETLTELTREAERLGFRCNVEDGPNGVWLEFVTPRASKRPRASRSRRSR